MSFFSYSQLAEYEKCPFRFKLERMDKVEVPLDERRHYLGTVLSLTIEQFYKAEHWRRPDPLAAMRADLSLMAQRVDLTSTCPWAPHQREQTLQLASDTLATMLDTIRAESLLGVRNYTEFEVQVPINRDTVVGRADLIIESPGGVPGLVLVDGKAGGTLGRHVRMAQLQFYACGMQESPIFQRRPDKLGFWWFRHGKVIWRTPTDAQLARYRADTAETIARLRNRDFTPKPTADCRLCDVRAHCPTGKAFLRGRALDPRTPDEVPGNLGVISL